MSNELVSIGIPTYNRPLLFERALKSVLSQKYDNIEIIISQNGGDDYISKILNKYDLRNFIIKYYHQESNLPVYDHFNFLLNQATGKYFCFLADDDVLGHEYVSTLLNNAKRNRNKKLFFSTYADVEKDLNENIKLPKYGSSNNLKNIFNFITSYDDVVFYGLYDKETLIKYFPPKLWPKPFDKILTNTVYPFLFEFVKRDLIHIDKNEKPIFFSHDYTPKSYKKTKSFKNSFIFNFFVVNTLKNVRLLSMSGYRYFFVTLISILLSYLIRFKKKCI